MSRELRRKGPLGLGRSPASPVRDRRNSDTGSSYLQVADPVPDANIRKVPLSPTEQAFTGIILQMKALQDAHNALLESLRDGQVIGR